MVTIEHKYELCRRERKALDREEGYYGIAYCPSREGMKTLAFFYPRSKNSRNQQYLPILRAKAFKSCFIY